MKLPWYGWAAIAALLFAGLKAAYDGHQFEQRATRAEAVVNADGRTITRLEFAADSLGSAAAKVDTVRVHEELRVVQVDSASHPDTTCRASIAVRDSVIDSSDKEIDELHAQLALEILARTHLTADRDTLQSALASRPRVGLTLELMHPTLHLAAQAMVYPVPRLGLGVSLDIASLRL
jgi:hypothetical protein